MSNWNARPCSVPGCTWPIRANLLMCYAHWQSVPHDLQLEVWRVWREQGGFDNPRSPSPEYLAAAQAAIESVAVGMLG